MYIGVFNHNTLKCNNDYIVSKKSKGVFKGGGVQGVQTPPKFSDFFLKSEGKEIERKRKKGMLLGGGGGYLLTYFWG